MKAYARLKQYREQENLDGQAVTRNWDFYQTSSWINYYLGAGPFGRKFGIRKPEA